MILELLLSMLVAFGETVPDGRVAMELYDNGMYAAARTSFEALPDDCLTDGYEILCALKLRSSDADRILRVYEHKYEKSPLYSEIHFEKARILFDEERYSEAYALFCKIEEADLPSDLYPELAFKKGFSCFARGRFPEAKASFAWLETLPVSQYSAPARYACGVIEYTKGNFDKALESFDLASEDPRFTELCSFYILECRFLQKDYDYVISNAEQMFQDAPEARREHIARILSESYLVRGNKEKARDYYDLSYTEDLTRSDYFYGGSVLYAVDDYEGAIANFTKMEDRSDSLGQIANYQLANAYLRTRNKVAALEAFRDAARAEYDPVMQEDAYLNYAKLAFDLNQDNSGFEGYIQKYSTSKRGEMIYGYMALTALNRHDYAAAVEAYDNIDELDADMRGNYMKANFLRGVQLYNSGAYRDAVPCLRAAAYYLPNQNRFNQLSRYWLAESYYKDDKFADAEKIYSNLYNVSALQGIQEGAVIPYNLAYAQFNQSRFESAARWFDSYIAGDVELYKEDAMLRRADCDFGNHDYKAAIKSYQKIIEADFAGLYPYYRQALSYGLTGDRKNKVKVLEKAAKANPESELYDDVLYELGRAYVDVKDTKNALETFHKLRETTKDSTCVAKALLGLGMVNRNSNALDQALEYYKEVVSKMYGSSYADDALLAIESIYQAKKQPQKYLEYVESNSLIAAKSDTEKELLYFNTAEQLFLNGSYSQAVGAVQRYLESYPEGSKLPEANFYLAESYRAVGAKEKACDYYIKVVDLAPESSFAETSLLNYSKFSYELEHFDAAYEGYSKLAVSAKLEANVPAAKVGMMRSAFKGRNYEAAIEAASAVESIKDLGAVLAREAVYVKAKSFLATSQRTEALSLMRALSARSDTPEGAEASFFLIQDMYDRGEFDAVEKAVYDFTSGAGDQSYWLARAFIILGDSFVERDKFEQAEATYVSVRDGYQAPEAGDDIGDLVNARITSLNNLKNQL